MCRGACHIRFSQQRTLSGQAYSIFDVFFHPPVILGISDKEKYEDYIT